MSFVKDLDTPILRLTESDTFSWRHLCAGGLQAFGGTGGGKTSSCRMLAGALLRSNAGGIVTCVKAEDISLWKQYAYEHGRSSSLIIFDESEGFNFLTYELARQGMDGIGSVTECLMTILEAARQASANPGTGGEAIWVDSARQVLRYSIPPLYAASGSLSVSDIIRFVATAPKTAGDIRNKEWQESSFMYSVMAAATLNPKVPMEKAALQANVEFWADEFAKVPDKMLGSVVATITTTLDRFRHGRLAKAFCGKTTVLPELTFHGSVIVLAMPTLTWNEDGIIAQQLFKYMWQRAVLSRNSLAPKHRDRFVFCYSDESQETISGGGGEGSGDGQFLGLCRASRACMICLTQSLHGYYAKIGGANAREATHSFVNKFTNFLYFTNGCPDTNEFAARMIGKVLKRRKNYSRGMSQTHSSGSSVGGSDGSSWSDSSSYSHGGGGQSYSSSSSYSVSKGSNWSTNEGESLGQSETDGYSESMEYVIEPGQFARGLKTGGPANDYEVTCLWLQAGRVFQKSGSNVFLGRFKQQ